jgi:hypothetical protein
MSTVLAKERSIKSSSCSARLLRTDVNALVQRNFFGDLSGRFTPGPLHFHFAIPNHTHPSHHPADQAQTRTEPDLILRRIEYGVRKLMDDVVVVLPKAFIMDSVWPGLACPCHRAGSPKPCTVGSAGRRRQQEGKLRRAFPAGSSRPPDKRCRKVGGRN